MPDNPLQITVVLGSVTPPGRLHRALSDAVDRAARKRSARPAQIELIDLGAQRIAWADGRPPEALDDDTARVVAAIAGADGVVLATPVYRGSLTGALKNLLDHVPVAALRGTPVGIVAMGGSDHHYLGVERHLRDVLAFFGAHPLPTAVYLSSRDFAEGVPGERAAGELDELFAAVSALAQALRGAPPLGPAPLASRF